MSGATGQRQTAAPDIDLSEESERIIADLRENVRRGEEHWFHALMRAVRDWPLPAEQVGDREYCYLVGGEAFDWLLLVERLCEEIEDLIPVDEREELLFHGRLPEGVEEVELAHLLGAKQRAHLNFVYGVRVETALQLVAQEEVLKERLSRVWENGQADDEVFGRLYGATRVELLAKFWESLGQKDSDEVSLAQLDEFTYWLFRRRVNGADPARVASDTRKGVAMLERLEGMRRGSASSADTGR